MRDVVIIYRDDADVYRWRRENAKGKTVKRSPKRGWRDHEKCLRHAGEEATKDPADTFDETRAIDA